MSALSKYVYIQRREYGIECRLLRVWDFVFMGLWILKDFSILVFIKCFFIFNCFSIQYHGFQNYYLAIDGGRQVEDGVLTVQPAQRRFDGPDRRNVHKHLLPARRPDGKQEVILWRRKTSKSPFPGICFGCPRRDDHWDLVTSLYKRFQIL